MAEFATPSPPRSTATTLVENAKRAEDTGFEFAMVSDHFHPRTDAQGESPCVWSVIGGIARETHRIQQGARAQALIRAIGV